jgi:hypothetical protein
VFIGLFYPDKILSQIIRVKMPGLPRATDPHGRLASFAVDAAVLLTKPA